MERILKFLLLALIYLNGVLSEDSPRLEIQPNSNTISKSLGGTVYISCQAIVPNQESVSGMKWFGPDGVQIPNPERPSVQLLTGNKLNQLDLYITNLKEEDTGMYNCSATYTGNQNLNAHVTVASYKKITFQDVKPKQTFAIGTDAKIKCLVTGDPAPEVDFLKGGNQIRENDPKIIIMADGILIKKIQVEDEGVYVCRARVPSLGEMKLEDIQVEVHIPPEITGAPQDIAGVEKESVAFQCVAKGKPAPTYSWVNKDNEVLNNKEGYYVDEIKGELRIMDLKPEHTGTYRCTAKNAADEVTAEAYLTVLTKPKIEEYKNITVGVDDSAIMKCIVTGDPLPEVLFTKEGSTPFETGVNQDDRIFIKQEEDDQRRRVGIMEISGIRRKDDGLYTCTGNSSGGVTVAWGHITVEFAPSFEDQTQTDFWTWEQKPVNISCLATSIPNATVSWFLRNEPIRENDKNYEIMSHGPNGILKVTPLDASYFDVYTCRATNSEGQKDLDVQLKEVHKPGPVSSAQVNKTTATTVSWFIRAPINDGGLPIKGFTYQYRLENTNWELPVSDYWSKDTEYLVTDLKPQAKYVFRFAARNDVGDGEWSGEKVVTMNKIDTPEEPFIHGVKNEEVNQIPYFDHYALQWKIPLDNGRPIDKFQIIYYKLKNASKSWELDGDKIEVDLPYPESRSSYTIENLQSDTYYKIELRAHNDIGFSTPAEIIIKTSQATGTTEATSTGQGIQTSYIIIAVVVAVLLLVIVLDIALFFVKNVGVTAAIVKKFSATDKEKDKEAMLDEAINASGAAEGKNAAKDVENGKHDIEAKGAVTETTPMIIGEDKEAILKEEKEILKEEESEQKNGNGVQKRGSKTSLNKDSPV